MKKTKLSRRQLLQSSLQLSAALGTMVATTDVAKALSFAPGFRQRGNYWMPNNISTTSAPAARVAACFCWTGSKFFIWGGMVSWVASNTGALYDPFSDTWSATSTGTDCPTARYNAVCLWTGTEVIVWGGTVDGSSYLTTGSKYNPNTNTWTAMAGTAPSARAYNTFYWNGTYVVVWGGEDIGGIPLGDGKRYDPSGNTWLPIAAGGPTARTGLIGISFTATDTIMWGGFDGAACVNTGARYNPNSNTWSSMTSSGGTLGGRANSVVVSTGSKILIWGGQNSAGAMQVDGAQYDPVGDSWTGITTTGAPSARFLLPPGAIWTGTRMLIWGGATDYSFSSPTNTGYSYDPLANSWTAFTTTGALTARSDHAYAWTGSHLVIWGGSSHALGSTYTDGKMYKPIL